jgi:ABC-2 type transport system ATP-binding protein
MIQIDNVMKYFDDFLALDQVTLDIPKGTAYGLIGSNGAGKSTLLRLLSGIYRADGGGLTIDGDTVYDNAATKGKIFFVNDETVQFQPYTLTELLSMYQLFYDDFSVPLFTQIHGVLDLPMNKKLSTFSKGMKKQAALIFAIAAKTDFLFLDEVFDGLDPTIRIIVKQMLADTMKNEKLTVILSSHNLREIDELCDAAGLIHKGKLVFNRQLNDIRGNIHKIQTAFDTPVSHETFPDINIIQLENTGSIIHIIAKGEPEELRAKIQAHNPKILDILPLSLEEVFIHELEVLGYEYNRTTDTEQ